MKPRAMHPVQYSRQPGRWPFRLTRGLAVNLDMGLTGGMVFEERGEILGMLHGDILTIFEGYQSDGASPCVIVGNVRLGTPSPQSSAAGFFTHDFMYQFAGVAPWTYEDADNALYWLLRENGFRLSGIYHSAVAIFGGLHRRLTRRPSDSVKSHPLP